MSSVADVPKAPTTCSDGWSTEPLKPSTHDRLSSRRRSRHRSPDARRRLRRRGPARRRTRPRFRTSHPGRKPSPRRSNRAAALDGTCCGPSPRCRRPTQRPASRVSRLRSSATTRPIESFRGHPISRARGGPDRLRRSVASLPDTLGGSVDRAVARVDEAVAREWIRSMRKRIDAAAFIGRTYSHSRCVWILSSNV